jgi:hypothetical protein
MAFVWRVEEVATSKHSRWRYVCSCGHKGRLFANPNDADGDTHLYRAHNYGD